ncbi:HEAT repeat domain-containing protein [Candidatus Omnitrophota bacterium]
MITRLSLALILIFGPACSFASGEDSKQDIQIDEAIKNLGSYKAAEKKQAIDDLVSLKDKAVAPLLDTAKDSANPERLRSRSISVLGQIGDKSAVKDLIMLLDDKSKKVRGESAYVLGNMQDKSALKDLVRLLDDKEDSVRYYVVEAIGKMGDKTIAYAISQRLLVDPSESVRYKTLEALDKLEAKKEYSTILGALSDPNFEVRSYAAELSGIWKLDGAERKLANMVSRDEDEVVRRSCALALVNFKTDSSKKALIEALDDNDEAVRVNALVSLNKITGEDYKYNQHKWREWLGSNANR